MKTEISLPELGLVGMTRGMLGIGIGLLAANRLHGARKPLGLALVAVGLLTTVPLLLDVLEGLEEKPAPRRKRAKRTAV
ncbi:MAG: hypothetical protein ABJB01_10355 [Rudaea sp.]